VKVSALSDGCLWSYSNGKTEKKIIDLYRDRDHWGEKLHGAYLINHNSQRKHAVELGFVSFYSL